MARTETIRDFSGRFIAIYEYHDNGDITVRDWQSRKPRSYLPKYEIEAIVRTFFPAVAAFFETEEGNREFEEWKAKKEAEKNAKEKTA